MNQPGNQIYTKIRRASPALIESYHGLPTPNIADNMSRMFCADSTIRPVSTNMRVVGSAITVKVRPGDNLFLHKALDMAKKGDVIVVDGQGDLTNSLIGEIMIRYSRKRGIAGIIVDGTIRDFAGISNFTDIAIFSKGYAAMGPYKDGPGEINTVISCGGAIVRPGDIVVADSDGVVFVPILEAPKILQNTLEYHLEEAQTLEDIENDRYDRQWIDIKLKALKTQVIDDYYQF